MDQVATDWLNGECNIDNPAQSNTMRGFWVDRYLRNFRHGPEWDAADETERRAKRLWKEFVPAPAWLKAGMSPHCCLYPELEVEDKKVFTLAARASFGQDDGIYSRTWAWAIKTVKFGMEEAGQKNRVYQVCKNQGCVEPTHVVLDDGLRPKRRDCPGLQVCRGPLGSDGENDCVSNSAVNGVRLNFACHHKPKVPEACYHETEWICEDCEEFNRIDEHLEVVAEEEG